MIAPMRWSWDHWGGLIAVGCAIHCGVLPMLPLVASTASEGPWGLVCMVLAAVIGGIAMGRGWRLHRDRLPLALWGTGATATGLFHAREEMMPAGWAAVGMVLAGALMAWGHWQNRGKCRCAHLDAGRVSSLPR